MFPFSHNMLMILSIILAIIHIALSTVFFILYVRKVKVPSFAFPAFFTISIVACFLIMLFSIDCKIRFGKQH